MRKFEYISPTSGHLDQMYMKFHAYSPQSGAKALNIYEKPNRFRVLGVLQQMINEISAKKKLTGGIQLVFCI